MKVARLHGPGDLRLHDEPEPVAGPGEELVRVTAVGLCGSDRHWFLEGQIGETRVGPPLVLGHEISGVVASGPRAGQRVAVEPAVACGACETCRAGLSHLCPTTRFAGHGATDGGLRTFIAWPGRLLVPIPDGVDDDDAALLEPLGVALHALDLGKLEPGRSAVAVIGCGPIGLLLIQLLAARGHRITVVEPLEHRRAAAIACGAVRAVAEIATVESPAEVAFEVAGEDEAVATAIGVVRPGGRVVMVGIPATESTAIPASIARRKGLTLLWSRRMAASALERAVTLVATGAVHPGVIASNRFPLREVGAAFEALADRRGLKVLVEGAGGG